MLRYRMMLSLVLILLIQLMFISSSGAQGVTLDLGDGSGPPGGTASVQLTLDKGGESVSAVAMDIGFDNTILSNPRAEINPQIGAGTNTDRQLISSELSPGVFRIGIIPASFTQQSLEAIIPDGLVATVTFDVSSNAAPGATTTLTNTPSASRPDGQALPSVGRNGTVTIIPRSPNVVINEVYPYPGSGREEWIEIYNPGSSDISLASYKVRDGDGELDFTIPQSGPGWDGVLSADSHLVIYISLPGVLNDSSDGDSVSVLAPDGTGVDFVRYGNCSDAPPAGTTWTGANPQTPVQGQSLGRDGTSTDTNDGSDWENTGGVNADDPTPGRRNLAVPSGTSISLLVDSPMQPRGVEFPVRIQVGTATKPVTDLFGLSFKLDYTNTAIIDAVEVDIEGSFLGTGTDVASLDDIDDGNGLVSIGITRVAGVGGVDGYGIVAQVKLKFINTAPIGGQSTLSLRDVTANAPDGSPIDLEITPTSITLEVTGIPVWPGDTNNDGIVDERDVLPVGVYWRITGPPRSCHSPQRETSWQAHSATVWTPEAATYADANGDGIVDGRDILAIGLNWHKTHNVGANAAASLAGVDHRNHLKAYKELYRALENAPDVESTIRMRQYLAHIIADALPKQNVLCHNFPNPFNPDTWIPYELAEPAEVKICIYNASGQLIRTLDLGYRDSGYYLDRTQAAYWDGKNDQGEHASSGLYFCQMQAGSFVATTKMIILR